MKNGQLELCTGFCHLEKKEHMLLFLIFIGHNTALNFSTTLLTAYLY